MNKKTFAFMTISILSIDQIIETKPKKTSQKVIKDKTCQDIHNLLEELEALFKKDEKIDSISNFLTTNRTFFDTNKSKIKRFHKIMDESFVGSEKRTAQKKLNFIYAFYVCDEITDLDNDEKLVDFIEKHYEKSTSYINSVKHVKYLGFNHTHCSKDIKSIIKFLKKDKIVQTSSINDKLLYSTINHLENIYYNVRNLGEFKQEKKKQNLHLTAEITKNFFKAIF